MKEFFLVEDDPLVLDFLLKATLAVERDLLQLFRVIIEGEPEAVNLIADRVRLGPEVAVPAVDENLGEAREVDHGGMVARLRSWSLRIDLLKLEVVGVENVDTDSGLHLARVLAAEVDPFFRFMVVKDGGVGHLGRDILRSTGDLRFKPTERIQIEHVDVVEMPRPVKKVISASPAENEEAVLDDEGGAGVAALRRLPRRLHFLPPIGCEVEELDPVRRGHLFVQSSENHHLVVP